MSKLTKICLVPVLAIGLSLPAAAQNDVTADTVVATINGTEITIGHMILARSQLPEEYQQLPAEVLFEGIREQLIQQVVLVQSMDELSKRVQLSLDNERRALIAGEAISIAAGDAVSDEALQQAYEERFTNVTPQKEYNASHILVETEEEAARLVARLRDGANFTQLAQEFSTGPSGPGGGSLGWFGEGRMVPAFEAAVLELEVGGISDPIETQFGWHVITLNDVRNEAIPSLDETREDLVIQIQRAAAQELVDSLLATAVVSRAEAGTIDPSVLNDVELVLD